MHPDGVDHLKRPGNLPDHPTKSKESAHMGNHVLQPLATDDAAFEAQISVDIGGVEG
jgi:hypothetical protein